MGFVLPINKSNGLPIPFEYPARNAEEIRKHFFDEKPIASFVNAIMAQPLADTAPFCLLLFGSDSKLPADDVSNR